MSTSLTPRLLDSCLELIDFVSNNQNSQDSHFNDFIRKSGRKDRVYPAQALKVLIKEGLLKRQLSSKRGRKNPLRITSDGYDLANLKDAIIGFKRSYKKLEDTLFSQFAIGSDGQIYAVGLHEAEKQNNFLTSLSALNTLQKAWILFVESLVARYSVLSSSFSNTLSKKMLERMVLSALTEHFSGMNAVDSRIESDLQISLLVERVSMHISDLPSPLGKRMISNELQDLENALRQVLRSDESSPTSKKGMEMIQELFQRERNQVQK